MVFDKLKKWIVMTAFVIKKMILLVLFGLASISTLDASGQVLSTLLGELSFSSVPRGITMPRNLYADVTLDLKGEELPADFEIPETVERLLCKAPRVEMDGKWRSIFPVSLCDLPNLKELVLDGSDGLELPEQLTMSALTMLSLCNCGFQKIPECVHSMPKLRLLYLYGCYPVEQGGRVSEVILNGSGETLEVRWTEWPAEGV